MEEDLRWTRRAVRETWRQVRSPLYRNAFFIMLSSVLGQGLGFFFWLVVARSYTTADVGYAVALFQTLSFLATLATLGLGLGIIRYLPETKEKTALVNAAATICIAAALILAVAFLGLVEVVTPNLAFVLENPIYPVAVLATIVALTLPAVYDGTSYAVRRAEVSTWRILIFSVLKIPLAVGFASVSLTQGHIGVFLALAMAFIVSVLIEIFLLVPRVLPGYEPRFSLNLNRIRPMFLFSIGNHAASSLGAAGALLLPLLILAVQGAAGATDVAYYYIATVVAGLLNIVPMAIFTSFYSEASQMGANRYADERRAILLSIILLIPGIVFFWFFSGEMLVMFGDPGYAIGAVDVLRVLIFGSIPLFMNSILITRIRIRKRSAPLVIGAAISTATILALGVVLLQTHGIIGLAVAYLTGTVAATPYYYLVGRKPFEKEHDESS